MAPLDSKVAAVLDKNRPDAESDDEDALIAELEEDDQDETFSGLREKRLQQLHEEMARAKTMKTTSHGTYSEIKEEKQLMEITTSTKLCVVHFGKSDFNRCRIMDDKLRILAEKHFDTRFVRIDVENAPFLVVKLGIQVLPCVIAFKDGVSVDRIIGFEGIGYKPDSFTVSELETRLLSSDVLVRAKMTKDDDRWRRQKKAEEREDDDDDDWD
nr:thioredoxin domain-containing protein plp1 [Quercus suber]